MSLSIILGGGSEQQDGHAEEAGMTVSPPYAGLVMTVGVDLSVQPKQTGVAWIDWSPSEAQVRVLDQKYFARWMKLGINLDHGTTDREDTCVKVPHSQLVSHCYSRIRAQTSPIKSETHNFLAHWLSRRGTINHRNKKAIFSRLRQVSS
jgi:hypothetical protein